MKNKNFTFNYKLTQKVVRDLKIVTETVGWLTCECVGCLDATASRLDPLDRYHVEFESVRWHGMDVLDMLQALDVIDAIQIECVRYFATIAEDE